MKDCYKITQNVKICGRLNVDNDGNKFISVEIDKDCVKEISFDEIVETLIGKQILIKNEDELE